MTFLNSLLLFGAAAASIPLLIHLLHRSRFRTIDWGAMHLLEVVLQENQRRIRLREILLLLIRCALPILLALCLARPLLTRNSWFPGDLFAGNGSGAGGQSQSTLVLAIDDTLSMQLDQPQASAIETAQRIGLDLVDGLAASDAILVRLGGNTLERSTDRSLESAITSTAPVSGNLDGIEALATLLNEAADLPGGPHRIVVVSDFQSSNWESADSESLQRLKDRKQEIPISPSLSLVSTRSWNRAAGEAPAEFPAAATVANVSVDEVQLSPDRCIPGQSVDVFAKLVNRGADQVRGIIVVLQINGVDQERRSIDLTAGGTVGVRFTFTAPSELASAEKTEASETPAAELETESRSSSNGGASETFAGDVRAVLPNLAVTIRCELEDALPSDNQNSQLATVGPPTRVAVYAGTPVRPQGTGAQPANETVPDDAPVDAADFLLTALSPFAFSAEAASGPLPQDPIQATRITAAQLNEADLESFDVLILADPADLPDASIAAVERFRQSGRGILIFGGPEMALRRDSVNESWWNSGAGALPVALAVTQDDAESSAERSSAAEFDSALDNVASPPAPPLRIRRTRFDHPALEIFNSEPTLSLSDALIQNYLRVQLDRDPADDASETSDGATSNEPASATSSPSAVRAIVRLDNGQPLIIEGGGLSSVSDTSPFEGDDPAGVASPTIFVTTSAAPPWNNLALQPGYLPLVQNLVHYLSDQEARYSNSQAAGRIGLPTGIEANNVSIVGPGGRKLAIEVNTSESSERERTSVQAGATTSPSGRVARTQQVRFTPARASGLYQIRIDDAAVGWHQIPRSVDESQLEFLSADRVAELAESLGGAAVTGFSQLQSQHLRQTVGREIWRWFWWAVLALLVLERAVVWSLGKVA